MLTTHSSETVEKDANETCLEKIFISHSLVVVFSKLHKYKEYSEEDETKQGKVGARAKKLKNMKFRVVVLWCGAQK